MGRRTTFRPLPDSPSDPRITNLDFPLRPPKGTIDPATGAIVADTFRNRNVTNTTPIQLVGNAPSIRALPNNPRRTGLIVQNKDSTNALYVAFGLQADINSISISAGGFILLDFTVPNSEIYLFATANVQSVLVDISRGV